MPTEHAAKSAQRLHVGLARWIAAEQGTISACPGCVQVFWPPDAVPRRPSAPLRPRGDVAAPSPPSPTSSQASPVCWPRHVCDASRQGPAAAAAATTSVPTPSSRLPHEVASAVPERFFHVVIAAPCCQVSAGHGGATTLTAIFKSSLPPLPAALRRACPLPASICVCCLANPSVVGRLSSSHRLFSLLIHCLLPAATLLCRS